MGGQQQSKRRMKRCSRCREMKPDVHMVSKRILPPKGALLCPPCLLLTAARR